MVLVASVSPHTACEVRNVNGCAAVHYGNLGEGSYRHPSRCVVCVNRRNVACVERFKIRVEYKPVHAAVTALYAFFLKLAPYGMLPVLAVFADVAVEAVAPIG